jgi:hypothetical protein
MSMKNSNDTIGNRTRDLPVRSALLQPTAPPAACHVKDKVKSKGEGKFQPITGHEVSEGE